MEIESYGWRFCVEASQEELTGYPQNSLAVETDILNLSPPWILYGS